MPAYALRPPAARQQCVQGIARVGYLHPRFALRVVGAALVAQRAFAIEDEDMRRGLHPIGPRG